MGRIRLSAAPEMRVQRYENLKGADFSVDPSLVSQNRSPAILNMISDSGGNPVKRVGWRSICYLGEDIKVHNIFEFEINDKKRMLVHAGTKIFDITDNMKNPEKKSPPIVLKENVSDRGGTGFFMRKNDKAYFFILTGAEYLYFDGEKIGNVTDIATVPLIMINRKPKGGGIRYKGLNYLSDKMTVEFLGDGQSKEYHLVHKYIKAVENLKVMDEKGEFKEVSKDSYDVDLKKGVVTFKEGNIPGEAFSEGNIRITYSKEFEGYKERINSCTVSSMYGYNSSNRVFLAGDDKHKAYDYMSEIKDPTFFSDENYSVIGTNEKKIIGYCKVGSEQAIIKEDNNQDTSIFLRNAEMKMKQEGDGLVEFVEYKVKQSIAGIGGISAKTIANLGDEQLILTKAGIHAIVNIPISYGQAIRNRSNFIDRKLLAEKNLGEACACEYNGYYILAINNHAYVLDGRNKAGNLNDVYSSFVYESYYFDNIPAVCFCSREYLYFGTKNGHICKFNHDLESSKYFDEKFLPDGKTEEVAIISQWATPNDSDVGTHMFKTLQKKGTLVTLGPFSRSGGEVMLIVDGVDRGIVAQSEMDIFSWADIDFERFTFSGNESPGEIYLNNKKKKYKRIMIVVRNDRIHEAFSLHEIIKLYTVNGYSKNRGGE